MSVLSSKPDSTPSPPGWEGSAIHTPSSSTRNPRAESGQIWPTVSVIVPIYNGEADLPTLLDRLLIQTYPRNRVEFWLVDNGSCDRTLHLLQTAATTAQHQGTCFHPLTYTAIQSSYAARNAGIQAATGEILVFTDADCVPEKTWLASLVQPFMDPTVGLVAGAIHALPGHTWLEHYADRKETLSQASTLTHAFRPYGQTANLAVRAAILREVGLFRPYLTSGGDADLCWRIQQAGDWQLAYAESAIVHHRHRQTLQELRRQWYRYGTSNRYLHELYGVDLMRDLTPGEIRYRLTRWLLKELPLTLGQWLTGQAQALDLLVTPLDLVCFQARTEGQRQAQLSDAAREIAQLDLSQNSST